MRDALQRFAPAAVPATLLSALTLLVVVADQSLVVVWIILAVLYTVALLGWIGRLLGPRPVPEAAQFVVAWDDAGLLCTHPRRAPEAVPWDDVVEIGFQTNDTGPFTAEMWVLVNTRDGGGVSFPRAAPGVDALVDALVALPGADAASHAAASASTGWGWFPLWEGEGLPASARQGLRAAQA